MTNIIECLRKNEYPGRGIIMGQCGGFFAAGYFLTGRSENSRNRVLTQSGGVLKTEPYDSCKVTDPSLIIYNAARWANSRLIVTNGDHTDTAYDGIMNGQDLKSALINREYEPDAPNYTPRISGVLDTANKSYTLGIIKRKNGETVREYYDYRFKDGVKHMIHTYKSDGNPLPSFEGEPKELGFSGSIEGFAEGVYASLDRHNRIAVWACFCDINTGAVTTRIINRNLEG